VREERGRVGLAGERVERDRVAQGGPERGAVRLARRRRSPMIRSGSTSTPKIFEATVATARCCSGQEPSLAMVADVPTWMTSGLPQASRTRRSKSATSAPWRPR
jgi:hypothetical protein